MDEEMQEREFWEEVGKRGLPWFSWVRRSVEIRELDREFEGTKLEAEWVELKKKLMPGDRILPFDLRVRSVLGGRRGYVVVRGGKAVGGVVMVVS